MFDDKDRKDEYSSDELELMKMIKEYEQDESKQVTAPEAPIAPVYESPAYQAPELNKYRDDSALNNSDHTRVMSRQDMTDETLTILPMGGNKDQEMQFDQTQELYMGSQPQTQPQPQVEPEPEPEDDDPRFELKRNKKKKPKKKKDKKPKGDDDKLNRIVLIAIIVASIIAVLSIGYMVYDVFFKGDGDEKITETDKKPNKKPAKKDPVKEETPKDPETPDHTAEIAALQKLIDQETTNMNTYTNRANELQSGLDSYNQSVADLEAKVKEAQDAYDNASVPSKEQEDALANAIEYLAKFKNNNIPPKQSDITEARKQASISYNKIQDYKNQIAAYQ